MDLSTPLRHVFRLTMQYCKVLFFILLHIHIYVLYNTLGCHFLHTCMFVWLFFKPFSDQGKFNESIQNVFSYLLSVINIQIIFLYNLCHFFVFTYKDDVIYIYICMMTLMASKTCEATFISQAFLTYDSHILSLYVFT